MTKFIIRRLLQAIPTLIGVSIIAFVIMQIAPGDPLRQQLQDPRLTAEDRQRIYEAHGFFDPIYIKYFKWLIGDAPIAFSEKPAWAVELSNGDTVIVDSASGQVREIRPTEDMRQDVKDKPIRRGQAGEREVDATAAGEIALSTIVEEAAADAETPEIVNIGWLPYYGATVIWGGRQLPVYVNLQPIGEEVGTAGGVLRGDFGTSYATNGPAEDSVTQRLGATFELGGISLLVGLLIGLPVGVLAAVWQGSIFDQATRIMTVLVSSIPVFWLGLILLLIFGSWLQWLPMGNRFPISFTGEYTFWERVQHLILPVFTLSSFTIATFSRFMRASILDVLGEDYVRTAQSKGLSQRTVWFKHALRNAMIPIATLLGPSIVNILTGAVLTETIYSWPGMGRLTVNSVVAQDYPVIMVVVLLLSVLTIVGYILSDLLYAIFDPRIRLS